MQNRRDFLKTAAFAALGSGIVINEALAAEKKRGAWFNVNRKSGARAQMKLRFFAYELKLRHVFTVATYSRSTTPDVQVELEYDGVIGYGEASMPPYLQKELGTLDSVMAFLKKVQDTIGRFSDPFQMEDILAYIDGLSEGDAAAKAAVDIALQGKGPVDHLHHRHRYARRSARKDKGVCRPFQHPQGETRRR